MHAGSRGQDSPGESCHSTPDSVDSSRWKPPAFHPVVDWRTPMNSDTQSPTDISAPSSARILVWALAVATPLAWSSVAFVYFGMLAMGRPLSVEHAILAGLQDWYPWALLRPADLLAGTAIPARAARLDRRGPVIHLICGIPGGAGGSRAGHRDQPVLRPDGELRRDALPRSTLGSYCDTSISRSSSTG